MTPLVLARAVNFAAGALELGVPATVAIVLLPALLGSGAASELTRILWRRLLWKMLAGVVLSLLSGTAWLVFQTDEMSGQSLSAAALGAVLTRTQFGGVILVRLVLTLLFAAALAIAVRAPESPRAAGLWAMIGTGAAAMIAIAWSGHAAATAGWAGAAHLTADAGHLLAAGLWLGGLLPLTLFFALARRLHPAGIARIAATATRRFSALGLACVAVILVSGIVNTWLLVGDIPRLVGTDYGHLLLLKIGLFLVMLGLAAFNRQRLTPDLTREAARRPSHAPPSVAGLQRNALIETAIGAVILVIVAILGELPPGLHAQPWWPFPDRPSTEALQLPGVAWDVGVALAACLVGIALVGFGLLRRRRLFWALPIGAALLAWYGSTPFQLLTVTAYPTSFEASPEPYATRSIASALPDFAANCAPCHGPRGMGDGPAKASLPVPPADLTEAHVLEHPPGDLFWWISRGIPESGMPGFSPALGDAPIWDLVNLARTLPVGGLPNGLTGNIATDAAPAAPDFPFETQAGTQQTLYQALENSDVLLVIPGDGDPTPRLRQLAGAQPMLRAKGLVLLAALPGGQDEASGEGLDFLAIVDPSVAIAYRLLATAHDPAPPDAPIDLEFLVDRGRYVRALWRQGALADPPELIRQLDALAAHPLATQQRPAHVH